MRLIRDLKNMDRVSPDWIDAFENYISSWLNSLVPHYIVAKQHKIDLIALENVFTMGGEELERIEMNNIHYYIHNIPGAGRMLSFNANNGYFPCNWKEGFDKVYTPESESQHTSDWLWYSSYVTRYLNRNPPCDELGKRIERLFREMVNDNDVGFDFGSTSYILMNNNLKWYINNHKHLTA